MIDLTVKTLDSQNHVFSLDDDQITVRGFKEHIAEAVAVPADSQRLIYCGRVLQDEKKLNDYDVNGKVIHLVQRAPPQPGQHGSDGGQTPGQNNRQGWQNPQRPQYRVTRAQMHGNAMYLGAMSVPAEIVEGHGIPQLSNSLSGSRLNHAGRMLDRISELIDRLDDPNAPPLHPTPSELNQPTAPQQPAQHQQESDVEQNDGNDGAVRFAEAAVAAITAALSAAGARGVTLLRGNNYNGPSTRSTSDANENQSDAESQSQSQSEPQAQQPPSQPQTQPQAQQSQQQQQPQQAPPPSAETGASSMNAGQNRRAQQQDLPRPPQMAGLLQRLSNVQERMRPYLERYIMLMLLDPSLPPGPGPNTVEESQRIVDGVSEVLHLMSHCCHALSDIIVDMSQPPPRNLRCRPIIVQHSAILQPGIPIQVEAHISLNGRGTNNNNSSDEATESGNQQAQSENAESTTTSPRVSTEESNQERESESTAQSQAERPQQEQGQSPFVFNLPNNVEVLMEVSNVDGGSGNEQNAGNENNNNGNARRTNVFPFGTAPPPYFMRNFMQAVAGAHMMHGGIATTNISTRSTPVTTVAAQQGIPASAMDSGTTNAGQSTQARSNSGTHPTTATQTRSTSRPHVFHHHAHPMGLGMSIGLGLDFDPYLPCNSHHVYRTPASTAPSGGAATAGVTTSSQTTTRTMPTTTADAQNQTATTSTTTTSATNATSATNTETANNTPFVNMLQQILSQSAGGQTQSNISINSNALNLLASLGNMIQMFGSNIHVWDTGFVNNSSMGSAVTLADLFSRPEGPGLSLDIFTSNLSGRGSFLVDLFAVLAQNMTLDGLIRLRLGQSEPIARLRRPLQEFLQYTFPRASSTDLEPRVIERLLLQLQPHIRNLLASEEDTSGRSGSRIDIYATVESLIARHVKDILRILFDNSVDDARFGQEILNILIELCNQICMVLRYSLRGGQAGLEAIALRFVSDVLIDGSNPPLRQWMLNGFIAQLRNYFLRIPQLPDSEIVPLLVYKDASSQQSSVSSASTRQSTQAQSQDEPMETETVEQQTVRESSVPEDREEIPETFPGHEALPSDWVPIIARDSVRQRRQLQQMQGVTTNSGVTTFSDAYLGGLPTKRRKLIEQQKPRLLVSPTPNHHSTIAASMERLVREGVGRAGVEEVEGAAVAVAADPAVRRAFGQAIRDCLNPCRYGTPDFPDPLRFPNATKYFADQERPPK
ncbi:large proline-rich protein bag6 isoform X2 [Ooceraea biroi]|uniref:large proline-rich protein bag6 isoform X2 n=1 Tax=Ooceraea biroi TaxID=2015173 RepID=UPI0005BC2A45|nr:large proline-rich protein bag6 isoform X2 [Ooceraea biroi]